MKQKLITVLREVNLMKEEYDIEKLNPRKNPYSRRLKKQVTINIDCDTIDFFKTQGAMSWKYSQIPRNKLRGIFCSRKK